MGLFSWLGFLRKKRERAPEVIKARELSASIAEKAEAVQESLQVYHRAQDPLAAMIADLYTKAQVARIWQNGGGKHP